MKTGKRELKISVIENIMERGIAINKTCKEMCRDFQIMVSKEHPNMLLLRWTVIDISNPDNPMQCYRYECFKTDGSAMLCSLYYTNQQEANDFLWSLEPLYHQDYAIDHKL